MNTTTESTTMKPQGRVASALVALRRRVVAWTPRARLPRLAIAIRVMSVAKTIDIGCVIGDLRGRRWEM